MRGKLQGILLNTLVLYSTVILQTDVYLQIQTYTISVFMFRLWRRDPM